MFKFTGVPSTGLTLPAARTALAQAVGTLGARAVIPSAGNIIKDSLLQFLHFSHLNLEAKQQPVDLGAQEKEAVEAANLLALLGAGTQSNVNSLSQLLVNPNLPPALRAAVSNIGIDPATHTKVATSTEGRTTQAVYITGPGHRYTVEVLKNDTPASLIFSSGAALGLGPFILVPVASDDWVTVKLTHEGLANGALALTPTDFDPQTPGENLKNLPVARTISGDEGFGSHDTGHSAAQVVELRGSQAQHMRISFEGGDASNGAILPVRLSGSDTVGNAIHVGALHSTGFALWEDQGIKRRVKDLLTSAGMSLGEKNTADGNSMVDTYEGAFIDILDPLLVFRRNSIISLMPLLATLSNLPNPGLPPEQALMEGVSIVFVNDVRKDEDTTAENGGVPRMVSDFIDSLKNHEFEALNDSYWWEDINRRVLLLFLEEYKFNNLFPKDDRGTSSHKGDKSGGRDQRQQEFDQLWNEMTKRMEQDILDTLPKKLTEDQFKYLLKHPDLLRRYLEKHNNQSKIP